MTGREKSDSKTLKIHLRVTQDVLGHPKEVNIFDLALGGLLENLHSFVSLMSLCL